MVDVKDKDGYTVLQAAVKAAWVAGVCIALEAGADVTIRVIPLNKTQTYKIFSHINKTSIKSSISGK